jgi:hypothetical protein
MRYLIEALDKAGLVVSRVGLDDCDPDSDIVGDTLRQLGGPDCWQLRVTWLEGPEMKIERFAGQLAMQILGNDKAPLPR